MTTVLMPIFLVSLILVFGVIVAKITEQEFARMASRSVRRG